MFLNHIPKSFAEKEISKLLPDIKDIKNIRIVKNKLNESKGYAYIDFVNNEKAN